MSWDTVAFDCDGSPLLTESLQHATYWFRYKLKYPINLLRNVARYNAKTYYVMALDIELLPSQNFVAEFMHYISNEFDRIPASENR